MKQSVERALSIQQPWAWLISNGHKDVENRNWPTKFRGAVLIHAGKKFDKDGYEWVRHAFPHIQMPAPNEFDKGGIVGQAVITGCVKEMNSPWFFGRYGFTLTEGKALPFIPCKGMLGLFTPGGEDDATQPRATTTRTKEKTK